MERTWKIIFNVSRIVIGLVFIFSGFVKGIDPLGSTYKFNDYFMAAGLPQMDQLSLFLSFLLSTAELLIGAALLVGIFMNLTAWTALAFMAFFTVLTLILAIFNPVTDCGCFGDAIKLTNWETFFKNVIFSVLVLFIFIFRKKYEFKSPKWIQWVALCSIIISFVGISLYSYRHLPLIDFMPYKVGSNIPEKMAVPPGAPVDEYQTVLVYKNKKTGESKEFTMDNYPWQDTLTWKWENTANKLIKKGYTPPIHDFSISDINGSNVTQELLNDTNYSVLFIAYNTNKANQKAFSFAEKLYQYSVSTKKFKFYPISASVKEDIDALKKAEQLSFDFYSADETAMKTVIRSNPGILILKKGVVIGKYHFNDFEKFKFENASYLADELNNVRDEKEWAISLALMFGLAFVIAFVWGLSLYFRQNCKTC